MTTRYDPYLSTTQVAAILGLHRKTVVDLIHRGELDHLRLGSTKTHGARYRVPVAALNRYVEARTP